MKRFLANVNEIIHKYPTATFLISWVFVVLVAAVIFYLRYPYTYSEANFYAEDGTVFVKNILEEGPLVGALSLFNGYFVLGQYILVNVAMVINFIFGHGLETLPKAIAVVSYLFWGLIVSLPYLLFRKKLGTILSLLTVLVLCFVPFGGYDYAIIGTIGNLKFAFFFAATLLVIFRNDLNLVKHRWQFVLIDLALLLCALTNIITVVLLPFCLWRYRDTIRNLFKKFTKTIKKLPFDFYSLIAIAASLLIYVVIVYARGIPDMPGYLDEPLIPSALLDILYRGSVYGLTFSANSYMTDGVAVLLLVISAALAIISKQRVILLFIGFAIIVNVLGFALSRPGITHLYQAYTGDGGPGLFFYAGTMLFIFAIAYAVSGWFNQQKLSGKFVIALVTIAFVLVVAPASGSPEASHASIAKRPSFQAEVDRVCAIKPTPDFVEMGVYPAENWTLTLPRDQVCS